MSVILIIFESVGRRLRNGINHRVRRLLMNGSEISGRRLVMASRALGACQRLGARIESKLIQKIGRDNRNNAN